MNITIILILIFIFNMLDMITTYKALELGAEELNPIAKTVGLNPLLKIGLTLVYCTLSYILYVRGDKLVKLVVEATSMIILAILVAVVINNMAVIIYMERT